MDVGVIVGVSVDVAVAAKAYTGEHPSLRITDSPKVEGSTGMGLSTALKVNTILFVPTRISLFPPFPLVFVHVEGDAVFVSNLVV